MSSDKVTGNEPADPHVADLLRAVRAGDQAEMRRVALDLLGQIDQAKPEAVVSLDGVALALGRAHLLDDLRRALTPEQDARMTEVVRGRCCPTVRAAWKYASYDLPNEPLPPGGDPGGAPERPGAGDRPATPPAGGEGHPYFAKPPTA